MAMISIVAASTLGAGSPTPTGPVQPVTLVRDPFAGWIHLDYQTGSVRGNTTIWAATKTTRNVTSISVDVTDVGSTIAWTTNIVMPRSTGLGKGSCQVANVSLTRCNWGDYGMAAANYSTPSNPLPEFSAATVTPSLVVNGHFAVYSATTSTAASITGATTALPSATTKSGSARNYAPAWSLDRIGFVAMCLCLGSLMVS